jgi:zinc transport system substrate-binding protein
MRTLIIGLCLLAGGAPADVPRVAVDIAPVYSIVASVMGDLGIPDLIVSPGASPHGNSLRPSEARALAEADVVVWIGEQLAPWLAEPIASLAADAQVVSLLDVPGTFLLDVRTGATFSVDDHEHGHADSAGLDPHAWLDPDNAVIWAAHIAEVLAAVDPENEAVYTDNAAMFSIEISGLKSDVEDIVAPYRSRPFVVFHDAFHYFENRFEIEAIGAVSASDASAPSPARVAEVRDEMAAIGATCALTEPQFNAGILAALGATKSGELDPIGVTLEPGPQLYPMLLEIMATSLVNCLK